MDTTGRVPAAVVLPKYADLMLRGEKTVEARLMRTRRAPFGAIAVGERVYVKRRSGPFVLTAIVCDVEQHEGLTPDRVRTLRDRWDEAVHGDDAYWDAKASARYAVFVSLGDVTPVDAGPDLTEVRRRQPRAGWLVLPGDGLPGETPSSRAS